MHEKQVKIIHVYSTKRTEREEPVSSQISHIASFRKSSDRPQFNKNKFQEKTFLKKRQEIQKTIQDISREV